MKKQQSTQNTLISMAWQKMHERMESTRELAAHLDISYVYLMKLARGESEITQMDRKVFEAFADYLDIPVAQAMQYAGALQPSDFLVKSSAKTKMTNIFERMKQDPEWGGFVPATAVLEKAHKDLQILLCLLYERETQTNSLSSVTISQT